MSRPFRLTGLGSGIDKDRQDYTVYTGEMNPAENGGRPIPTGHHVSESPRDGNSSHVRLPWRIPQLGASSFSVQGHRLALEG
jgi:hypothetical protein